MPPPPPPDPELVARAAEALMKSDALLIAAGAGMGVDSGLPDFRGDEGFWRAYPAYRHLGLAFEDLASPRWFEQDPGLAWGFYGHRRNLYRSTRPHAGFEVLLRWAKQRPGGAFVFTSNVDGQFQRAGFDEAAIDECHGAIDWSQCVNPRACDAGVFRADQAEVQVDPTTFRAGGELPRCPSCGGLARPNILMFGDFGWDSRRAEEQAERRTAWLGELRKAKRTIAVVELGAGTAIPTVRMTSERVARTFGGTLIRINPREPQVPDGFIGIPSGARATLEAIAAELGSLG
jgi:NAD-dependent SIR2 family protein deacetylase